MSPSRRRIWAECLLPVLRNVVSLKEVLAQSVLRQLAIIIFLVPFGEIW
jgi:hypothetical protein